jgi:hypothetical protein
VEVNNPEQPEIVSPSVLNPEISIPITVPVTLVICSSRRREGRRRQAHAVCELNPLRSINQLLIANNPLLREMSHNELGEMNIIFPR